MSAVQGQKPLPQPEEAKEEARWVDPSHTFNFSVGFKLLQLGSASFIPPHDWNKKKNSELQGQMNMLSVLVNSF